ncbi:hypothetical protein ACFLYJ_01170 [Candidatus Cloacimonadota bacterium]
MQIYVRHLKRKVSQSEITKIFGKYGTIKSIKLISEKDYPAAYVEMPEMSEAEYAITELNSKLSNHKYMQINKARMGPNDRRKHCRLGGRRGSDLFDA